MKTCRYITITVVSLFALLLGGCTQPDGHIGPWFGSWYLEEMLINGEIDEQYAANKETGTLQVLVSFQGNVFNMAYLNGNMIYGTWSYAGEILTLVAAYNAGGGYQDENFDPFPKVLYFPADVEEVEITVTKINGRTMQWQFIDQNGRLITYNFKKYP